MGIDEALCTNAIVNQPPLYMRAGLVSSTLTEVELEESVLIAPGWGEGEGGVGIWRSSTKERVLTLQRWLC